MQGEDQTIKAGRVNSPQPLKAAFQRMAPQWEYVRSYIIKDGRLYLSLMADGGIFEFERSKRQGMY